MAREVDARTDLDTAGHIAKALQLQAHYGFDFARGHLLALGVDSALAQRLLAVRYQRRRATRHAQHTSDYHA